MIDAQEQPTARPIVEIALHGSGSYGTVWYPTVAFTKQAQVTSEIVLPKGISVKSSKYVASTKAASNKKVCANCGEASHNSRACSV
jgi:hypothetical protein